MCRPYGNGKVMGSSRSRGPADPGPDRETQYDCTVVASSGAQLS